MRFLNTLGNKAVLARLHLAARPAREGHALRDEGPRAPRYEQIAAARVYFGDFDPFGDFDLLLGASRLNLKIVDLPVRYQARTYGETKISRFRTAPPAPDGRFRLPEAEVEIFRLSPSRARRAMIGVPSCGRS